MKIKEFTIGTVFYGNAGFQWLCTDKGERTITAIMLDPDKKAYWFEGPPYSVEEKVFDEYDMKNLYLSPEGDLNDILLDQSAHPGFDSADVFKMLKVRSNNYPHKKLLKRDRVNLFGDILHPYGAVKKDKKWFILVFDIFAKTYSEILEDEFVQLSLSSEESLKKRKNHSQ